MLGVRGSNFLELLFAGEMLVEVPIDVEGLLMGRYLKDDKDVIG